MKPIFFKSSLAVAAICVSASFAAAQASRGSIVVYPMVYDSTGTNTSRTAAKNAILEILKKGGFVNVSDSKAAAAWRKKGYKMSMSGDVPSTSHLAAIGKASGAKFILSASVHYHTRSIWVNLGPKTISNCQIDLVIVNSSTGKVVYSDSGEGRSDEKSVALKAVGALLITPFVTVVSGGPKTPQETRAAQIAAARAMQKFVEAK